MSERLVILMTGGSSLQLYNAGHFCCFNIEYLWEWEYKCWKLPAFILLKKLSFSFFFLKYTRELRIIILRRSRVQHGKQRSKGNAERKNNWREEPKPGAAAADRNTKLKTRGLGPRRNTPQLLCPRRHPQLGLDLDNLKELRHRFGLASEQAIVALLPQFP